MLQFFFRTICVSTFSVIGCQLAAHAAERALLEPDWDDEAVARAQSRLRTLRSDEASPAPAGQELTLPRWGLGNIQRPTRSDTALARSEHVPAASPLPACAAEVPTVETSQDETKTWYADSFDYGCIRLTVSGNRNYKPDLKFPTVTPGPSDCDPAAISAPAAEDAPDSDTRGRFEIQLTLNKIPYSIDGDCLEGAEAFCESRAAQCALVDYLILKAGGRR